MQYKLFVTLLFFILSGCLLHAQNAKLNPLKIGDTIPDITLKPIVNWHRSEAKISDFRGKAILLDFWSLWCSGCIAAFPKLEALQQEFKDELMIMPVSFMHTEKEVKEFYKRRKAQGRTVSLPSAVYADSSNAMLQLFPVTGFPLEVWVDQNGVVRHVTDAMYVTVGNLKKFISGQAFELPVPHLQPDFDAFKPFLVNNNGGPDTAFTYRSLITPYIDSVNSNNGFVVQQSEKGIRLFMANASAVDLVKTSLYGKKAIYFNKKVIVESPDSFHLVYPAYDENYYENMRSNAYCYELILPPPFTLQEAYNMMHQDICSFFRITACKEKRMVPCLVLKRLPSFDSSKLISRSEQSQYGESVEHLELTLVNRPVSDILLFLDRPQFPLLMDETNFKSLIDIQLSINEKFDLQSVNESLSKYGLVLEPAERQIEMLVISSKK